MPSPDVFAVYFPSYHPDPHYDRWYGPGWTEWDLVREARPLFDGHRQPKACVWGCFNEADPAWSAREIDLAADHGLDGFMFDWYWYEGVKFLHGALEDGFLKAPNRRRLKFFVMWANHTWGVFPACRERYRAGAAAGAAVTEGQALAYSGVLLPIRHTLEDLERVAAYCAEHYFREPNYYRIGDRPLYAFWYPKELLTQLGSPEAVTEGLRRFRARARAEGAGELHLTVNIANVEPGHLCWQPDIIPLMRRVGFDSVFGYNISRTQDYGRLPDERPVVDFGDVMESHRDLFARCQDRELPFHPVVTVGFDNSARWHRGATLPVDFKRLGYEPIVVGNTPERVGALAREALACAARRGPPRFVLVNAWNEWTEGNYLLPEAEYGTGYLEALRDARGG